MECSADNLIGPGFQSLARFKLYPGQKVYLTHGGREYPGLVEQHNHMDSEVRVYVGELGLRALRRIEDVRLGESSSSPRLWEPEREPTPPPRGPSSHTIDVPPRASATVDMDEIMAAMVLSSLSCSPRLNPSHPTPVPGSGDSGNGSGSSSDHWSGNSSSLSPPPFPQALGPAPGEEGDELHHPHPLSLEESGPRKQKNSLKLLYRCMWPRCQKCLSSTVGIRRHIRTVHLGRRDSEHSDGEEDFYYTEIQEGVEPGSESLGGRHRAPPFPNPQPAAPVNPQPLATPDVVPDVPAPTMPALSRSAPSCLRQVSVDHTYQVSPESGCTFTLVGFPSQLPAALVRPRVASTSPPPTLRGGRKVRGEAKKCRKVYGVENRGRWCTACRWKKACRRFQD
ncbi:zinc finger protein 395-like [Pristis pectinata]|uniref:zinc finger protein 395-like n=1 Tax=Pristis pectinata TaxID=685728 RepID=UPI00223DAF1D|nr:zinc finger protein 395-like [Pristis pectinata]